jgi:nitroreductase
MVMTSTSMQEWVMESDQPRADASLSEKFYFAVRCAVLAPSSHNSQPWLFKVSTDNLLLVMDRRRALPVADPHDRELVISCGAALFNIRAALASLGMAARIDVLPDPLDNDVLARISVTAGAADPAIASLCALIPKRMTNRSAYRDEAIAVSLVARMEEAARLEWAQLNVMTKPEDRAAVAALVAAGDRVQFEDVRFRRELASWLHPRRQRDGLSAFSTELTKTLEFATPLAALVVRTFDLGNGVAAKDAMLAKNSPLLACISTATDDVPTWLASGQALQRMLLVAVAEGYSASYLNQPIEVATLRGALAATMHTAAFPQVLLRLGHGLPQSHSPRRELDDVLL